MDSVLSRWFRTFLYCVLVLYSFHITTTSGKYLDGTINTKEDWEFLARFCFLSNRGRLRFEFEYPQAHYEPQNVLLYFDEPHQWDAVYKQGKTCLEKEAVLDPQNNQVINLTRWYRWSGCKLNNISNISWYRCVGGRSFKSSRERWWFIAISHCNSSVGLSLRYKLWMTNGESDETFFYQFSADEFYILQTDIAFLCAFFCMFILSIICGVVLRNRQLFHTTYKIYLVSITAEVIFLLIACIAYGKYANDGLDNYNTKVLARVFESASTLIFLLLLILMGKGFTITRGRISTGGSIKIAVFMTIYTITYIVLFIYEANFFDPGLVLYLYESPPGYGLIAMRILSWVWFCYAIFFTLKHYPEKSSFYYPFFIFYTIWFLIGPIFVLISYYVIAKWAREKIVNGVTLCIAFCAHAFFLFLTRPTAANKNFPYHVRTTQIGVLNVQQNGGAGGAYDMSENFPHHTYAADGPPEYGPDFTDVFTVSNTRSAGNNNKTNLASGVNSKSTSFSKMENNSNGGLNTEGGPAVDPDAFPHQKPGHDPFIVQR